MLLFQFKKLPERDSECNWVQPRKTARHDGLVEFSIKLCVKITKTRQKNKGVLLRINFVMLYCDRSETSLKILSL